MPRFVIAAGVNALIAVPCTRIVPDSIDSRPTMARMISDLPQPTNPAMPEPASCTREYVLRALCNRTRSDSKAGDQGGSKCM